MEGLVAKVEDMIWIKEVPEKRTTGGLHVDNIIEVVCIVFPTAEVFWFKAEKGKEYATKIIRAYKKKHQEFEDTRCSMGMVHIFMPEEKYNSIVTRNEGWVSDII